MKDLKISKELLSEVLKLEVVKHSLFNNSNKSFNITYMQSEDSLKSSWMPINIYGFAFRCKEWAYEKNYELRSWKGYCTCVYLLDGCGFNQQDYTENTEIEAIIKACEWILSEVNK